MERKKFDIGIIASGASKSALDVLGRTRNKIIEVADQNGDGRLDLKDANEIAGAVSSLAKKSAESLKTGIDAKAREYEERALQPIFEDSIEDADFSLTKLIRVCEVDKKRADSEICQGSIGYLTTLKELKVVNIYTDNIDKFGITFYPDSSYEFYYVDPRDRDRYIALEDYFGYLKIERINELQKIAQDLGATHFKVTYKEEKSTLSTQKKAGKAFASQIVTAEGNRDSNESSYANVEIAAEMTCPGHTPIEPKLNYLQKDSSVQNLIAMRMDEHSPISHHKFSLKLSNSSGIKESDAIKIDAALKLFKSTGNFTVTNEVQNEARRQLEYEIDF